MDDLHYGFVVIGVLLAAYGAWKAVVWLGDF